MTTAANMSSYSMAEIERGIPTCGSGPRFGTGMRGARPRPGEHSVFDCWPRPWQRVSHHPWNDATQLARDFERAQELLLEAIGPKHEALGDEYDDPGALSVFERHRQVERQTADYLYRSVAPYAESAGRLDHAERLRSTALKMYHCRTGGQLALLNADDKPVIAWDYKCSCSKLCPDEARHASNRVFDRYAPHIRQHVERGGRVYVGVATLPNYPAGRLREGMRHAFARWRARIVRARKNKRARFPHVGSLVIEEAPLSSRGDWNVHLNFVLLTDSWLSYADLREAWGFNIEVRQHGDFSERGMKRLFNETMKYAMRATPEKSADERHRNQAPAFIEWPASEGLEWFNANHGFRRVRSYGALLRAPKVEHEAGDHGPWLARIDYEPSGYRLTLREHNAVAILDDIAHASRYDLDLIRGIRSPTTGDWINPREGPT